LFRNNVVLSKRFYIGNELKSAKLFLNDPLGGVDVNKPLALVIEDNEDQADILSKALQTAGFETEAIHDGDEAVARLAVVVPDLVLLDLHLPGVSGTGILLEIRADPRLVNTRVVIATVEPQMAEVLRDKADRILAKPIEFGELYDLAVSLISGR
jgi:CheY-like chemotaxis protein